MLPRPTEKFRFDNPQGLRAALVANAPHNFLLKARVIPGPGASYFGVRFRGAEDMKGGLELRFQPERRKVGFHNPDGGPVAEEETSSIYDMSGLERPFQFELVAKDDIVDVCVDNRRTLLARRPADTGNQLFLFSQDSQVSFENVEIRPLSESHGLVRNTQ